MSDKKFIAYLCSGSNGHGMLTHRIQLDEGYIPEAITYRGKRYETSEWDRNPDLVYYLAEPDESFKIDEIDVEKLY